MEIQIRYLDENSEWTSLYPKTKTNLITNSSGKSIDDSFQEINHKINKLEVETHENEKGRWIKFPDGTIIATMNVSINLGLERVWQRYDFPLEFNNVSFVEMSPSLITTNKERETYLKTLIFKDSILRCRVLVQESFSEENIDITIRVTGS